MMLTTATALRAHVTGDRCPTIPAGTPVRVIETHPSSTPGKPGAVTAVLPSGRRVVLCETAISYDAP